MNLSFLIKKLFFVGVCSLTLLISANGFSDEPANQNSTSNLKLVPARVANPIDVKTASVTHVKKGRGEVSIVSAQAVFNCGGHVPDEEGVILVTDLSKIEAGEVRLFLAEQDAPETCADNFKPPVTVTFELGEYTSVDDKGLSKLTVNGIEASPLPPTPNTITNGNLSSPTEVTIVPKLLGRRIDVQSVKHFADYDSHTAKDNQSAKTYATATTVFNNPCLTPNPQNTFIISPVNRFWADDGNPSELKLVLGQLVDNRTCPQSFEPVQVNFDLQLDYFVDRISALFVNDVKSESLGAASGN